jgi:hypothetical protein
MDTKIIFKMKIEVPKPSLNIKTQFISKNFDNYSGPCTSEIVTVRKDNSDHLLKRSFSLQERKRGSGLVKMSASKNTKIFDSIFSELNRTSDLNVSKSVLPVPNHLENRNISTRFTSISSFTSLGMESNTNDFYKQERNPNEEIRSIKDSSDLAIRKALAKISTVLGKVITEEHKQRRYSWPSDIKKDQTKSIFEQLSSLGKLQFLIL